ncbi:MAG TPA: metalloregulator ArsR/SmtB family transcription factor [Phycisphaerae bacterium]|jgi:DNA-binding transcriptional ArsR family regulator|nr:metalloregulator ArsR/SmtB family transcription factor [Phycisphaerae bacterium]
MQHETAGGDTFEALAQPQRREILKLLAQDSPRTVNGLVEILGLPQPAVSKHLGVLRKVGLVSVQKNGQHRWYSLRAEPLRPVHQWLQFFERFWGDHLDDIKRAAEHKARALKNPHNGN